MSSDSTGTVVLVHGGFVDGSGWQPVYSLLKKNGYDVSIVQNPTLSLEGDVAATNRVIDAQGSGHPRRPFLWQSGDRRGRE